jgi:TPR repeat protein
VKVHILAAMLVSFTLAGCVTPPTPVDTARQYNRSGRQAQAIALLQPLADKGDMVAQYELAQSYANTDRYRKDLAECMKWLLKSAEQGYGRAQFELGYHYAVDYKDYGQALKWYQRAAERSDSAGTAAARNLGLMYRAGQGVKQDYAESARWYRRAADQGDTDAQFMLGFFYFDGAGVEKDVKESIRRFTVAANKRLDAARYALVLIHAEGMDGEPNAPEAAYWASGVRTSDVGQTGYLLGRFYSQGFFAWNDESRVLAWWMQHAGVPAEQLNQYLKAVYAQRWADEDRAVYWYRKGAEAGFVGAQVNLARIHWDQRSRHWNCGEAVKWTKAAADKADATALLNMGMFYQQGTEKKVNGIGVELEQKDKALTIRSVMKGEPADLAGLRAEDEIVTVNGQSVAKLGISQVVSSIRESKNKPVSLGIRSTAAGSLRTVEVMPHELSVKCPGVDGKDIQRDPAEAFRWFQKAADAGHATGLFFVARAYREGDGAPQNYRKAMELYEQGASKGDWEAAQEISFMYSRGQGVARDEGLADKWRRRALDLKHQAVRRD